MKTTKTMLTNLGKLADISKKFAISTTVAAAVAL